MKSRRKIERVIATIMAVIMTLGICPISNVIADSLSTKNLCIQIVENGNPVGDSAKIACAFKNITDEAPETGNTGDNGVWETSYQVGEAYVGGHEFVLTVDGEECTVTVDLKNAKQYLIFDLANKNYTWSDNAVIIDELIEIVKPSNVTGIGNGVEKTKEALNLPEKVEIKTTKNEIKEAEVQWDVQDCDYDKDKAQKQVFTVSGTVILPETIKNSNNISLTTQIQVTVNEMEDAVFTTQPKSLNLNIDDSLSLTVATKNADENTYQWYKDGVKLEGQTNQIMAMATVKLSDAGTYLCKVKGLNGNVVSSSSATIKVNKITPNLSVSTSVPSPQTKPIDSVTLSTVGINEDATGTFTFYVNNEIKQSGASKEYVFQVPDEDVLEYKFKIVYSGNAAKYNSTEAETVFKLSKGSQPTPRIVLSKTTMSGYDDVVPSVTVDGGKGNGAYVYAIGEEYDLDDNKLEKPVGVTNIADINQSGKITVKRSGKFQITVYKKGDNNYNDSGIATSAFITVGKKAQTGFQFAKNTVEESYKTGKKIINVASGGESSGDIVYKVINGTDVVSIQDEESPEISVLKAGEATVRAIHIGDNIYDDAIAEYTIKINRGIQTLKFDIATPGDYFYGTKKFINRVKSKDEDGNDITDADGKITYSIESGENIASVNAEGELSFNDGELGQIKVKAIREECSRYEKEENFYILNIVDASLPSPAYIIDGEKSSETNEWYTGNITIQAPEGYEIGKNNSLEGEYGESIVISNEGDSNGLTVYLRNKDNGNITATGTTIDSKLLKLDKTAPTNINIEYQDGSWTDEIWSNLTYGFYQEQVKVKISAEDVQSGISELWWRYDKQSNTNPLNNDDYVSDINKDSDEDEVFTKCSDITIDGTSAYATVVLPTNKAEQIRGNITVKVVNQAGIVATNKDERIVIKDSITPTREIEFSTAKQVVEAETMSTCENYDYKTEGSDYKLYYDSTATAQISIKEANFVKKDINVIVRNIVDNTKETINLAEDSWTRNEDIWINKIEISEEGHHVLEINYKDPSQNEMKKYISNEIVIDKMLPVVNIEYLDLDGNEKIEPNSFKQRKAKITVTENNFRASDISGEVVSKNLSGDVIKDMDDYISYLKKKENWTTEGDIHTAIVTFDKSANYRFELSFKDLSGRESTTINEDFVVDATPPEIESVTYSKAVTETLINSISFSYYNPSVDITVISTDDTTQISKLEWKYNREENVSSNNQEKLFGEIKDFETYKDESDGKTKAKTVIRLPFDESQLRGNVEFTVYDEAGNKITKDEQRILVVDTISPTREVLFSKADRIVDSKTMEDVSNYSYTKEGEKYKLYYKQPAVAKITVAEANFYTNDIAMSIVNLDNNTVTKLSVDDCGWEKSAKEDIWISNIIFDKEGHYRLKMSYNDRSGNSMKNYISNEIIIDYTKPKINVKYTSGNDVRTVKSRKYYNNNRTAVITIKENNFRASDVEAIITAKDISGKEIKIKDFSSYLKQDNSWMTKGDIHTAKIKYSKDANYTFDISYNDLATKKSDKYKQDKFTIDKKAPNNLKVYYSKSVLSTIIENVSCGFYNAPTTVTIQAQDNISGVNKFVYSYKNDKNVSKKNAELLGEIISRARIKYSKNKKTATATFIIPKGVLKSNNQFRGKTLFDVYDKADNERTRKERKTIVVDNIAPQGTVTLNKPVSSGNGEDYYTGDITAEIKINEANFFKEDVIVKVNDNVRKVVDWEKEGDNWKGSVKISGDGHYKLTVDYKDKSQNKMKRYESNQLTIDTQKPTITVSGIKNESANKGKKIGFSIAVHDENLNSGVFNAKLKAMYKTKEGTYKTKDVDIGKGKLSDEGKSQTFMVENLTEDAIYTLECKTVDMAGNAIETFEVKDSKNKHMKSMSFSVNREGSSFMLDDYSQGVVDEYYVQKVDKDIKVIEVNVNALKDYKIELNKKELKEGTDFTVEKEVGKGKWSKYIYSINASHFKDEGKYSVIVSSTDKAKTTAYSDLKDAEVVFTVDKTAPKLAVAGLEKNGRYQTESQKVTIMPTDDGGRLKKLKVVVKDSDGTITSTPFDLEGEELVKAIDKSDNKFVFNLKEGMYQNVDIVCIDRANNEYRSQEQFYNITVSPSAVVMFWANTMIRWLALLGLLLILSVVVFLIVRKRKNK